MFFLLFSDKFEIYFYIAVQKIVNFFQETSELEIFF